MLRTPLKNSKNVNKPFKSPFGSTPQNKRVIDTDNKNLKQEKEVQPTLLKKNIDAKRVLLLDEEEKVVKRRKMSLGNEIAQIENICESKDARQTEICQKANEMVHIEIPENITKTDLLALKRKIFEMRQELDCIKSRERCTKKHDPRDLRASVERWKEACQNALEILCSELTERNGINTKISDVLNSLGIPETIVCYSEKDDAFI